MNLSAHLHKYTKDDGFEAYLICGFYFILRRKWCYIIIIFLLLVINKLLHVKPKDDSFAYLNIYLF